MTSRVPTAEPTLDELDKFRGLLLGVLVSGHSLIVPCDTETEAKKLRRRYYLLRDKLIAFEREAADCVAFSVAGRRVRCAPKEGVVHGTDWTTRVIIGAHEDDASSKGDIPPSDRLDNARRSG